MRFVAFSRWDPLHDLLALHERMNRLGSDDAPGWTPAVDLYETADRFVLSIELPGLTRDEIKIEVCSTTRSSSAASGRQHEGRRPASTGSSGGTARSSRSFPLPQPVDAEGVPADFRDGVLTVVDPEGHRRPDGRRRDSAGLGLK